MTVPPETPSRRLNDNGHAQIEGRYWAVDVPTVRHIPVYDLPQMSDERWNRMARSQPWWRRLIARLP